MRRLRYAPGNQDEAVDIQRFTEQLASAQAALTPEQRLVFDFALGLEGSDILDFELTRGINAVRTTLQRIEGDCVLEDPETYWSRKIGLHKNNEWGVPGLTALLEGLDSSTQLLDGRFLIPRPILDEWRRRNPSFRYVDKGRTMEVSIRSQTDLADLSEAIKAFPRFGNEGTALKYFILGRSIDLDGLDDLSGIVGAFPENASTSSRHEVLLRSPRLSRVTSGLLHEDLVERLFSKNMRNQMRAPIKAVGLKARANQLGWNIS